MSLMVVAAACLYSSLYTGFKAQRVSERVLRPLESAQAAMDLIMQDLRGAIAGPEDDPNILAGPFQGINDFTGSGVDTDTVEFYSTHHEIGSDTTRITCGLGLIELVLIQPADQDTYNLVRRVTDNILSEQTQQPVEEILCRNVHSLNIRYFDGTTWTDAWDSTEMLDTLPVAVEVTLQMEPFQTDVTQQTVRGSRYDQTYLNSLTKLTQVFTLPCGLPMDEVEAAAEAAEEAAAQASSSGGGAGGGG